MSKYFSNFPKTIYNFEKNGMSIDVVTNIMNTVAFEKSFKENSITYYNYLVKDGETPEMIAHKTYGSSEKHWIVLSMNDIINVQTEWPLSERSLIQYIDKKYSGTEYANSSVQYAGVAWSQTNVYQYFRVETTEVLNGGSTSVTKIEIDANTYANVTSSSEQYTLNDGNNIKITIDKSSKTYYEYEVERNDDKRNIKLLKPEFADTAYQELIRVFSE